MLLSRVRNVEFKSYHDMMYASWLDHVMLLYSRNDEEQAGPGTVES